MTSALGAPERPSSEGVATLGPRRPAHRSVAPYRFSSDVLDQLRPCFAKDNWHPVLATLEDWCVVAVSIAVSLAAWAWAPLPVGIVCYAIAVVLVGSRQRALATLLHDATHGILARGRWLNHAIGSYLSGYLILQSYSGYFATHVVRHHGHFGDELDPDYQDQVGRGLYGPHRSATRLASYLRGIVGPRTTVAYTGYLVRNRILPPEEKTAERWLRMSYLAALLVGAYLLGWLPGVLLYWLVPLATTANWVGALIELAEHYPRMEVGPRVTIFMSRNRLCGVVENFVLGVHNEGYHLIHHLFPTMPSWHYKRAHAILLQDDTYRRLNQTRGWRSILREMSAEADLPA